MYVLYVPIGVEHALSIKKAVGSFASLKKDKDRREGKCRR